MKETATNVWKDGLNKDLNPMNTPNTVLTDNLNGTFITYNGNELSLQNDMGNVFTSRLSDGFYPIGLTEFGDIIYIVSINEDVFEIGSFPSLNPAPDTTGDKDFEYVYRPLYNLDKNGNRGPFTTNKLSGYDLEHPVSIEVQPSYDGSVNLILTDGKNIPRLINSGFAVIGNGKGRFVERNQGVKTNIYKESDVEKTSRLINNSVTFTKVDLKDVIQGGRLKGGNYTFYFRFGDEDSNKTDIICESGMVSVFKGTPGKPKTISGAFANEITDKLIQLQLSKIDTDYSRIYVSYTREYCDLNGYRLVECKELIDPFEITGEEQIITISGVEATNDISIEDLNIMYHTISSVNASAQQQNMLFFGNLSTAEINNPALQNLSYKVVVYVSQSDPIGNVSVWNYSTDGSQSEYYDPKNIYSRLGYWPDELYRFGIVYIKSDGSLTQVFNLKGCSFNKVNESDEEIETNWSDNHQTDCGDDNIENSVFLKNTQCLDNIAGVFKTPDVNVLDGNEIKPLYFNFTIPSDIISDLKDLDIIGYFIVRQKRLPITICQGYGIGVDKNAYIPMLQYNDKYVTESFITPSQPGEVGGEPVNNGSRLIYAPVSINGGDVMDPEVAQGFKTYFTHVQFLKQVFMGKQKWQYVQVWGPKGDNPDALLYEYGIKGDWEDTEVVEYAFNKCKQWCIENPTLVRNVDYSHLYVDTWNLNSKTINTSGSGQILTNTDLEREIDTAQEKGQGLLSVEAMTNPELQSILCGSEFTVDPINKCELNRLSKMFVAVGYDRTSNSSNTAKLIYIPEETPLKYIDNVGFSTQSGDGVNVNAFSFLETEDYTGTQGYSSRREDPYEDRIVRGKYTPFIGVISENGILPNYLYNIRNKHDDTYRLDVITRANDYSEYYAVSDRLELNDVSVDVYRGDCFTNTVTIRMNRNFIDANAPIVDKIVKPECWAKYYKGYSNIAPPNTQDDDKKGFTYWDEINLSDLNTVSLGHWITFKCLANSNLGLRSEDTTNVSEMALMGNPRSFYPLVGASSATGMKLEESHLLNDGYNATVGRKRNTLKQDTPFDKNEFSTRIMFSNVSITDSFTNGYRIFQGASYQDYTKQYGSIIKLIAWGNNLFCVFEHGLAMIPVNEKALMQTTTEQTIHIYGHGVLPEQLSIISQDFGSLWAESVIRTPIGIYGVDTSAKKIWKYTDQNGLETISDLKLQRFLNDNINLDLTRQPYLGITNVKTHYNNYKGDVMFTFYHKDISWNLCYNERQALWVTRYSWIPSFSGNINNTFYSLPLDFIGEEIRIYKHGRTGVDTQFLPTKWYNVQHPFEFEFVVNTPAGVHKIFEDMMIISNNVQPDEIEFEFIGDDYLFNKARLYNYRLDDSLNKYEIYGKSTNRDRPYIKDSYVFSKDNYDRTDFKPMFYNATVNYDGVLDEYTLLVHQKCKNSEIYGRRLGNIQYKEDGWYTNIEPLRYNANLKNSDIDTYHETDKFMSAKLRDKWIKIRIKYRGDRLAIVNGVTTFENISYS